MIKNSDHLLTCPDVLKAEEEKKRKRFRLHGRYIKKTRAKKFYEMIKYFDECEIGKITLKHDYFNIFISGLKGRGEQISHKVKEYQYKKVLLIKEEFC